MHRPLALSVLLATLAVAPSQGFAQIQGPNESDSGAPDLSVYIPRDSDTFSYLRLVSTPALLQNQSEANLWSMAQLRSYFLTMGKTEGIYAPSGPKEFRVLGVDLGVARTAVDSLPILPRPPIQDSITPGAEYEPQWYAQEVYGPLDAVRASLTLTPYASGNRFRPTLGVDTRVPLASNQGSAEVLFRFMGDYGVTLGDMPSRISGWVAFQNKLLGLLEPVPGGKIGGSFLMTQGDWGVTLLSMEGATWQIGGDPEEADDDGSYGSGEFFNRTGTVELSQGFGLLGSRVIPRLGVNLFTGRLNESHYSSWSGGSDIPFSRALDLGVSARVSAYPWEWLHLYGGYSHILSHRNSDFLDGFYRPTGPCFDAGMSATVMKLLEIGAALRVNNWDGAVPPDYDWTDSTPPTEAWTQTALTLQISGRF